MFFGGGTSGGGKINTSQMTQSFVVLSYWGFKG